MKGLKTLNKELEKEIYQIKLKDSFVTTKNNKDKNVDETDFKAEYEFKFFIFLGRN